MSALFNFHAFMVMLLLFICLCSYLGDIFPGTIRQSKEYTKGFKGMVRKAAVIGDRLSPWVSLACFAFGAANIFVR
jgi:phage-related holin